MPGDSNSVTLQLLLEELKACRSQIDSLVKDVAELKASEATLALFWADNWGPLKTDIQDIRNRLAHLEQSDLTELERRLDKVESAEEVHKEANLAERVAKLEKSEYRRQGISAAAGAIGGGGIATLLRYFLDGGS